MFRKLSILLLTLILVSYLTCSISTYAIQPELPSETIEKNAIISLLAPHVIKAFEERNIPYARFKLDDVVITSIKILPNNGIQIKLNIRTFPPQSFEPPYGIYNVTVTINGTSVNINDIQEY